MGQDASSSSRPQIDTPSLDRLPLPNDCIGCVVSFLPSTWAFLHRVLILSSVVRRFFLEEDGSEFCSSLTFQISVDSVHLLEHPAILQGYPFLRRVRVIEAGTAEFRAKTPSDLHTPSFFFPFLTHLEHLEIVCVAGFSPDEHLMIRMKCWDRSSHVNHFRLNPEEYMDLVMDSFAGPLGV